MIQTFNNYQVLALRTASDLTKEDLFFNAILGLNGEAGELADAVKKYLNQGHQLDKEAILKEAGDMMWYIAILCESLGVKMDQVATMNIEKLKKRYPQGFDSSLSIGRVD